MIALIALAVAAIAVSLLIMATGKLARTRREGSELRRALDLVGEGVIRLNRDHRIEDINANACSLLGLSREMVLNKPISSLFGQTELPIRLSGSAPTEPTSYEINYTPPTGRTFLCQVSVHVLIDRHGSVNGGLLRLSDLTRGRKDESSMRQAAAVFKNATEGIMIISTAGKLDLVNPAFVDITGFSEEESIGRAPQFIRYGQIWAELISKGRWQGEIVNRRKNGEEYAEWLNLSTVTSKDGSVQNYIGIFSDVSNLKRSQEELKHLAYYDALTDLPNRSLLGVQLSLALERAARRASRLAVLGLDLDGFKAVNDTLGHAAGDLLLKQIAARIRTSLRKEDMVARMGGDEFAMIIENPPSAVHIGHLVNKIIDTVGKPVDLDGSRALVTASIGIAIYPQDGQDAATLLKAADIAMYASKLAGRNTFRYHNDEMAAAANQRMALEQGLRQAIEQAQLELHYQPQLDLATGEVCGVEALVRWNKPGNGLIPAAEFIPVAEEAGLILPLGEWVLRQACRQLQTWNRTGQFAGTVSVNVAGLQIERGDFVGTVQRILDETGLPPGQLILEITESVLLRSAKQAHAVLEQLHGLGVGVALDNFGTGYSSLAYLGSRVVKQIKIDRRFVQGLPTESNNVLISRAIIALAGSMGCQVLAEGVETEAQQAFLEHEGCHHVQGFLYAWPASAEDFEAWLAARQSGMTQIGLFHQSTDLP